MPHSKLHTSSHSSESHDKSDIRRASPVMPGCAAMTNRMAENDICWLAMLLQYGPNDLNGDNPCFSEWACQRQYEHDYPEAAHQSDWEARRVLAAEMMLWEIPHFSRPKVHTVLFINVFKHMAFLWMQECMRGDQWCEEKAPKQLQTTGNYQVAKDFDPSDPSQAISAITHTPPGPK